MKNIITALFDRGRVAAPAVVIPRGRARTCDVAFPFRMGAGFQGDVNRTHPFTVEPAPIDLTRPPLAYGLAGVIDSVTKRFRVVQPTDTALTAVYGIAVRPYPIQQATASNQFAAIGFGSGAPSTIQPIDVLRAGYIMVPIVGLPGKGDPVYVWCAASSGAHVQGGFESANPGGNGFALTGSRITFNGVPDSSGIGEVAFFA